MQIFARCLFQEAEPSADAPQPPSDVRELSLDADATVGALLDQVQELLGVEPWRIKLMYGGSELRDRDTLLSNRQILSDSTVVVVVTPDSDVTASVTAQSGQEFCVRTQSASSVATLKRQFAQEMGVTVQALQLSTADGAPLEDDAALVATIAGQPLTTPLSLQTEGFRVMVAPTLGGSTFWVMARPSDTLAEVKQQIQVRRGLDPEGMRFLVNGQQAADEQTVGHWNLGGETMLSMVVAAQH